MQGDKEVANPTETKEDSKVVKPVSKAMSNVIKKCEDEVAAPKSAKSTSTKVDEKKTDKEKATVSHETSKVNANVDDTAKEEEKEQPAKKDDVEESKTSKNKKNKNKKKKK